MTNKEFVQRITNNLKGVDFFSVGPACGCIDCNPDNLSRRDFELSSDCIAEEFSTRDCDSCGTSLAGRREPAHGCIKDALVHFSVCTDCLLYHANGDLPEAETKGD